MKINEKKLSREIRIFITSRIKLKMLEIVKKGEFHKVLDISKKPDSTIVTEVDHYISDLVKDVTKDFRKMHNIHFYSEEDPESFGLPCLMLDPIDGTREFSRGEAECVLSLAVLDEYGKGWGWLYNPFNGFDISSEENFVRSASFHNDDLLGLVSRTEYRKGSFKEIDKEGIVLTPRGSIAFKLGLVACNAADFVLSLSPKNIWDIAAGTIICWSRGIKLYQGNREVTSLTELKLSGPLLWCREEHYDKLSKTFKF